MAWKRRIYIAAVIVILCIAAIIAALTIAAVVRTHNPGQLNDIADSGIPAEASQDADSGHDPESDAESAQLPGADYGDPPGTDADDTESLEPPLPAPDPEDGGDEGVPDPATDLDAGQDMPEPGYVSPDFSQALDGGLQSAIDAIAKKYGAVGVQVAVIDKGEVAGSYMYGYATKDSGPMEADTKIRIASLSKVILAMTIMRLCELGRLDIDADIGEYWGAEVRNPNHSGVPITMRQILSHTSSIRVYDYGFAAGGELVRSRFLDGSCFGGGAPGSMNSWNYNNYAFAALGLTVEVVTGETVNSLAEQYLFSPLGIDAAFGSGSISGIDSLATLYTSGGGVGRSLDAQKRTLGSTYPGENGEEFPGGLTISAHDLSKLVAVLVNGGEYCGVRILSPESVDLMMESQGRTGGFDQCLPLRRLASCFGEEELYFHTGSNYGVFSLFSYSQVSGKGVVVLTTGANGVRDGIGMPKVCAEISKLIYEET